MKKLKGRSLRFAIVLLLILLLAGGGMAYYFYDKSDSKKEQKNSQSNYLNNTNGPDSKEDKEDIRKLASASESKKCTYQNDKLKGTYFFSGDNRTRSDYESLDGSGQKGGTLIVKDTQATWNDVTKKGFKTPYKVDTSNSVDSNAPRLDDGKDLKCEDWVVDEAVFVLPQDISFQDLPQRARPN